MYSTIIFLSIILILLSVMLCINIRISLDFISLKMVIVVYVYHIKVVKIKVDILKMTYSINKSKNKRINLVINRQDKILISQIKNTILDKLYYDSIEFYSIIGLGNCDKTAVAIGVINWLCCMLGIKLSMQNQDIKWEYKNIPNYFDSELSVVLNTKVYFTIFDMVFGVVLSFYRRGKYAKQKE